MNYLTDTNVLSELHRANGSPAVRATITAIPAARLYMSAISVGEIARGITRLPPSAKRRDLQAWADRVELQYAGRILVVDEHVARRWGETASRLAAAGRTLHVPDGLIAATALVHDLTLLTRNVADFADTGVRVLDPWTTPVA